ncbi:hypothetical protein DYB25_007639 [Aphanomyces astaci]|uniref:subtilisin n=1 Tax=Aphanomyces astaci TaxID=112090 RepID=A0A397BQV7_APHAT|nr:hypothetical protein DYB25_007639 [Aphanomyces astaci]RHZ08254.1 hypothetical protein DYB26_010219 [Aphanomyces astaci]
MVNFVLISALAALASAKIAPSVHRHLKSNKLVDVVIEFSGNIPALEVADIELEAFTERAPRIAHVRSRLVDHMQANQQKVAVFLSSQPEAFTVRTERYYIDNTLHIVGASLPLLEQLAKFTDVTHIRSPVVAHLPVLKFDHEFSSDVLASDSNNSTGMQATNEWGVNLIGASAVWASGNRGEDIVVGSIDTGALYTHDALKGNWRSTYGWFDPTDKNVLPVDTNGHGTHTIGSSVGAGGVGVAPGATWISCRGCTTSSCPEAALTACAQWMLCPTDVQGNNPKCELAPHVINNSWGGNVAGNKWYQAQVDAWQKAGIVPVFANGNAGPNCATVGSPGDYPNVIGVGAVGADDKLASFSSRGPTPDKRVKPDVSAPGYQVRSSWNTGASAYKTISGTSMATPHVTGAIALYLSANKGAKYADVYNAFTTTVDTTTLTPDNKNCGGVKDATYPNNNYGFGRINIATAVGAKPSPTTTSAAPVTTVVPVTTQAPVTTPASPVTTEAPVTSSAAPVTSEAPITTTGAPVTTNAATPAPTTTKTTPVTTTAASSCNGCKSCYSTSIGYCFPAGYSKAQCATFVDFKTIWCGA